MEGPIFDLRQDAIKQVQEFRSQHNTSAAGAALKTLKENANLQRVAQRKANRWQSGEEAGIIPVDTRNPLMRAHDNDIGASDVVKIVELCGAGATSVYEIMQAFVADTNCHVGLLDADVGYIGVGVGGGENTLYLVIELGQRPMEGAPELPEMEEFPSYFTGTNLLSLPGRIVQVTCETTS
jgi:uncharacterized protein YkwD